MYFASLKDKNPILVSIAFYGIIEDIWENYYVNFKVSLFKCKWVPNNNGVQIDGLGLSRVDLDKTTYMTKPFTRASQGKQVFYVNDPSNIHDQLFSKENIFLVVMKILIFLSLLLTQHKCIPHMMKFIDMMCILFITIIEKTYGKI